MGDRSQADEIWEHGENIYPGFVYKYCKYSKKGGGVTRFKQHLAGRGNNVKHCSCVPPDIHDYFWRELDRTKRLLREEVVVEVNLLDRSLPYQESNLSTSASFDDDDGDDGDYRIKPS
jgi:hypothetical protein